MIYPCACLGGEVGNGHVQRTQKGREDIRKDETGGNMRIHPVAFETRNRRGLKTALQFPRNELGSTQLHYMLNNPSHSQNKEPSGFYVG